MPPPVVRRAPYKDFLQPCLQRRFASTLLVLLAVAYAESLTLSSWDSVIWSWFPLGIAGLRALAIFACALLVVVLRIAHPHVGLRTSNSSFETFNRHLLTLDTAEAIVTYGLSAFAFGQLYRWAVGDDSGLHWINYHSGDRARLNERALFYTVSIVLVGLFEGFMHCFLDYDRMLLGCVKAKPEEEEGAPTAKTEDPFEKLLKDAPQIVVRSVSSAFMVCMANYVFLYSLFFRHMTWGWAMAFFRPWYNLPKSNIVPSSAPWSVWMLFRSIIAGTLLCLLWNFGNATFTLRLAKEPLKNGQPLTAESKDPNGSLLNGLKGKKPRNQAFAMWELALIARDFDVRRKAIFEDIDRKDGSMWSQIYTVCVDTIKQLERRIDDYGKPPAPPAVDQGGQNAGGTHIVEPPTSANVWEKAPPPTTYRDRMGKYVGDKLRSPGRKPANFVPLAQQGVAHMRDSLLTKDQQQHLKPEEIQGVFHSLVVRALQLPYLSAPFKQTFSRRLTTAVLGTPYGETSIYVNAAFTLSQLAATSLFEDNYGTVQRDVPAIIRTLTVVIKKLEIFRNNLPDHWTDVENRRRCGPVEEVLDALKEALARVVTSFEEFSADLRLTRTDLRLAKEAAKKEIREPRADPAPAPAPAPAAAAPVQQNAPEMRQIS